MGGIFQSTAPAVFGLLAAIELHPTNPIAGGNTSCFCVVGLVVLNFVDFSVPFLFYNIQFILIIHMLLLLFVFTPFLIHRIIMEIILSTKYHILYIPSHRFIIHQYLHLWVDSKLSQIPWSGQRQIQVWIFSAISPSPV